MLNSGALIVTVMLSLPYMGVSMLLRCLSISFQLVPLLSMACLACFLLAALQKFFIPKIMLNYLVLPFLPIVVNHLFFLKLVFLPPVPVDSSVYQKYMLFKQESSSISLPFASLAFDHNFLPTPQRHDHVLSNTGTVVISTTGGLHGGADVHPLEDVLAADDFMTQHFDELMNMAVTTRFSMCGGDVVKTLIFGSDLDAPNSSHGVSFTLDDINSFPLQVCTSKSSPSYDHFYFLCFHSSSLSFSYNNFSIHSSPPSFSTLILFESSFSTSIQKLHVPFSPITVSSCAISSSRCSESHYSPSHRINSESLKTLALSLHASAYQPSSGIVVPIHLKISSFQSLFHKFQFYSFIFLSSLPVLDMTIIVTICSPYSQLFYSSNNSSVRWPPLPIPNFLFSSLSFVSFHFKVLSYQP